MSLYNVDRKIIEKILKNPRNDNIIYDSYESIQKMKNKYLQYLGFNGKKMKEYHKKLEKYKYVNELKDIHDGNYIRYINLTTPDDLKLKNGGFIVDIHFYDEENIQIKCKNFYNNFFIVKFNESLIFKKLTNDDYLILELNKLFK
jgi:hypothetical protein